MTALLALIAAIAGAGQPAQAAMNAKLREGLRSPMLSACLSYAIGTVLLAVLTAFGLLGRGSLHDAGRVPAWAWLGGVIGAVQVTVNLIVVPRVSAGVGIGASLVGQLLAAVVMDHFGALGLPRVPINGWRGAGIVLLLAGIFLVQKR